MKLPFELKISDIWEAESLMAEGWPTKIVTLLGPCLPPKKDVQSSGDHHLRIVMDDVTSAIPGWLAPNASHINKVLSFTENFHCMDRVLIHCRGGISRSTSTSIGVLVQHGIDPIEAIRTVQQLRSCLDPNELIIHLMDHALGQKMQLIDAYQSWADCQSHSIINRMPRAWRTEIDSNARELYKIWDLHKSHRKDAEWRR